MKSFTAGTVLSGICLTVSSLAVTGVAIAEEPESLDRRFYLAPAVSYDFFDADYGIDDSYGYRLSLGKPLSQYFNLELTGLHTESSLPGGLEAELQGLGLTALWFPQRYHTPFFGILSVMDGDLEIGNAEESATIGELGLGYIHPIFDSGLASVRAEYRYRNVFLSDIDDAHDHVVTLGLEIPLGGTSSVQRTRAGDWTNPEVPTPPPPVAIKPPPPPACADVDQDGVCDKQDQCLDTPAGAAVLDNGCSLNKGKALVLPGVEFEFDKAAIRPESQNILDQAIRVLKETKGVTVEVGGHTDSKGSDRYNQRLSRKRAAAVREYLIAGGIAADRLVAKGYGESNPIAPNQNSDGSDNPEGRARNRRVELRIVD